jgi:hypothetical protein
MRSYALDGRHSTGVVPGPSLHPGATVSDRFVNTYATFANYISYSVLGINDTACGFSRESRASGSEARCYLATE